VDGRDVSSDVVRGNLKFLLRISIFKGLIARRLYKSFGVKRLNSTRTITDYYTPIAYKKSLLLGLSILCIFILFESRVALRRYDQQSEKVERNTVTTGDRHSTTDTWEIISSKLFILNYNP
jgi:hypothetical protein